MQIGKHKKGKRIRALLEADRNGSEEKLDEIDHDPSLNQDANRKDGYSTFTAPSLTLHSGKMQDSAGDAMFTRWASKLNPNLPRSADGITSKPRSSGRMLNVAGLNQTILEECIKGYFDTMEKWIPLTQGREEFLRRSNLFIRQTQGLLDEEDEAATKKNDKGVQKGPISEILLLAVVARGSIHSAYSALFESLVDRFVEVIHKGDTLTEAGLDGVEAVGIIHEAFFRTLHPTAKDGKLTTCLRMDPLGKGFPMELCLFHNLNDPASALAQTDVERAAHLFWVQYAVDALRSASACRMYRLHEDDIGWPFPSDPKDYPYIYISSIARDFCSGLFSQKSKKEPLKDERILGLLEKLSDWPEKGGIAIHEILEPLSEVEPADGKPPFPPNKMMELTTLSALWLRIHLSLWIATQGPKGEHLLPSTHERIERETSIGAARVEKLANFAVRYDLVDCGSTLMVSFMAAWFLYLTRRSAGKEKKNDDHSDRIRMAQSMVRGIRAARQTKGAPQLADALQDIIDQKTNTKNVGVDEIAYVSEKGSMPNAAKKRRRSTNNSREQSSNERKDERIHIYASQSGSRTTLFPSEEEQRRGASNSSESPATTITPSHSGTTYVQNNEKASGDQMNILMNDEIPSSTLLGSNVLAWDPDLLAFLDASFLETS
ncbi:hypothetical protein L7F22_053972 [Adiantum nelumboides]|nr:hypothetical protein [Adiantum nelumboides]